MSDNGDTKLITIEVNGRTLRVPEGYPVIQAALDNGILIPHYCYHADIGIDGNCRMCLGELEGGPPKLVPTCTLRAQDGMKVRTDTERVREAVQGVLEFILVNHPIDCPVCDQAGECKLQDYYVDFGMHRSHVPLEDKVHKRKVVELGRGIVLDAERCVLCSRCTRFTDAVTGTRELRFQNRGNHTEITTFDGQGLESDYSGNLADLCPVGALTSRDFRFKKRVWFLQSARSACDGCATNCSIRIDQDENVIYRYVPRRNTHVNASWMCDHGRVSYREVGRERLEAPLLRDGDALTEIPWEKALGWVSRRIREARETPAGILAIATPAVMTEELFLFQRFAARILGTPNLDYRVSSTCENPSELEDALLYRRDHYPNSRGAAALGLVPDTGGVGLADAAGRTFKLVYLLGAHRLEGDRLPAIRSLLEAADAVVMHSAQRCELLELADLVLPVAMTPEKAGTLVNHAGRVQRLEQAVTAPGEATTDGRALALIGEKLDEPLGDDTAAAVFAEITAAVEAFGGLDWNTLGDTGRQLRGTTAELPRVSAISPAPQLVD
ncbi:MAG: 2Fe-2S iron-sulfur cluster-binding protein [Candidatus Eiseniibacteriota bacterium]